MVTLLARIFIKNEENIKKREKRQKYGLLCGALGIFLNVLLFAGKFLAGTLSNSIAITADAFNNLSDAGSSLVTLIGFKLAGTKPDPGHPFGHGRIEYLSGLIVSCAILLMAYELIKGSIAKILHPQQTSLQTLTVLILLISIFVKGYMAHYNRRIGKEIDSAAMRATATDSLSDMAATTVVLLASVFAALTGIQVDGYCGVLVGLFIFAAGISAARETLNPLLGQMPDKEFVEEIKQIVMEYPIVQGIHDMVVHDYGPGRQMVSLHVEVPSEGSFLKIHDTIDNIEGELMQKLGCEAVIHMDPTVTADESVRQVREKVIELLHGLDENISMHDFRMVPGNTHTNLIFDVVIPFNYKLSDEEVVQKIKELIKTNMGKEYFAVLKVDKVYCN